MRILVVTSDYPPTPGGIARLSWCSALALHQLGQTVEVLTCGDGGPECQAFDQQAPFPTHRVSNRLGWRELQMFFKLRQRVAEFRPDIVWSALWFPCAWLATYTSGSAVQVVSTYGSEVLPNRQAGWKQWVKAQFGPLRQRVFRRCHWIFTLSRFTQQQVWALGAPPHKTSVLPGGVEPQWFSVQPAPKNEREPVLLTVARLDEHKGHDRVIQALPGLCQEFPGLKYRIVGPAAGNWERLESLAHQLGVRERIEYWGKVPEEELYRAYAEADLFVMPSREIPGRHVEGFGLTFLEAAALGLPSVGGLSGGVPDAVEDGYSGILVDPNSSQAIGEAVATLLRDRDLLQRLGLQARQRAQQQFSWQAIGQQMVDTFERLLATKGKS